MVVKCLNNFPNLKSAMKKTSSLILFSLKENKEINACLFKGQCHEILRQVF
jgi:hypothetical protein